MLLFVLFFVAITNLPTFWCSLTTIKNYSSSFLFENGKLTADCFNKDSNECLIQLAFYEPFTRLHLKGFVFDEVNVKEFSNIIGKLQLQDLILDRCNINDELGKFLTIPSDLKSFQLEKLNLSSFGIQSIISNLPSSIESLVISACFGKEVCELHSKLNLSKFTLLKHFHLLNSNNFTFDACDLLTSLTSLPLEVVILENIRPSLAYWSSILDCWTQQNDHSFSKSLKTFDFQIIHINCKDANRLINFLLASPHLEVFSLNLIVFPLPSQISVISLPANIKQFSLEGYGNIIINNSNDSFYAQNSLSLLPLTHLTVSGRFVSFPYQIFRLPHLEFLELFFVNCKTNIISSLVDISCQHLKHLSVKLIHLIPLLSNFDIHFPVIETFEVYEISSSKFDSHLPRIISVNSLKYLRLSYKVASKNLLKFERRITSSLEKLTLISVSWKFFCSLIDNVSIQHLNSVTLDLTDKRLDLKVVLEKFSTFPKLSALKIFSELVLEKESTVKLEELKSFELFYSGNSINLDYLLNCLPNLFELDLKGEKLMEFKLSKPANINFLKFDFRTRGLEKDVVNLVKWMPNLVQLRNYYGYNLKFSGELLAADLAYYFKVLKEHFMNDLRFEIVPNCLPITLLQKDSFLFQLVRLKSPALLDMLKSKFPLEKYAGIVQQLFTLEIENDLNNWPVDSFFLTVLQFFTELGIEKSNTNDILFIKKLFEGDRKRKSTETVTFSSGRFYDLYYEYLEKQASVQLNDCHREFIRQFLCNNKRYNILKSTDFLISFFTSISSKNEAISIDRQINQEIFDLFAENLLSNSFLSLINKIKDKRLSDKQLEHLFSYFDYEMVSSKLKSITKYSFNQFVNHFNDEFFECEKSKNPIAESFSSFKILLPIGEECPICIQPFDNDPCTFFQVKNNNLVCHYFHKQCLNCWLETSQGCPNCRRGTTNDLDLN